MRNLNAGWGGFGRMPKRTGWKPMLPVAVLLLALSIARGHEQEIAREHLSKPPVAIVFAPPDLEGTVVLGIFDAAGKLVRTLRYESGAKDLKIDTNGYVARWDGQDEAGKPCAPGRYSARGYVVGDDVEIEGEAFHFNDWMAEDGIPARGVKLRSWPDGVGVELQTAERPVFRVIQTDGILAQPMEMRWPESPGLVPPQFTPAPIGWAPGRDDTMWLILDADGQNVVLQLGKGDGSSERELRVPKGEPQPVEIAASAAEDAILLKENGAGGVQRVRMLKRGGAVAERNGRLVADWTVVFERSLQPCERFGLVNGKLAADAEGTPQNDALTVRLVENALKPGQRDELRLAAVATRPGSALISPEGLELVEISSLGEWNRFSLSGDGRHARLYQGDGVVVEEFAIEALDHIAAFDAGTFLLEPAE